MARPKNPDTFHLTDYVTRTFTRTTYKIKVYANKEIVERSVYVNRKLKPEQLEKEAVKMANEAGEKFLDIVENSVEYTERMIAQKIDDFVNNGIDITDKVKGE